MRTPGLCELSRTFDTPSMVTSPRPLVSPLFPHRSMSKCCSLSIPPPPLALLSPIPSHPPYSIATHPCHQLTLMVVCVLLEYWLQFYSDTSYILILDFRDTFFQGNPFSFLPPLEQRQPKYELQLFAENWKVCVWVFVTVTM